MVLDALQFFTLVGFTILVGYVGLLIFERTKIPDIIWLVLFGLFLGPVFHMIDITPFISLAPLVASLALLIILFDAGLNLNFYRMLQGFKRSIILAIAGVSVNFILIIGFSLAVLRIDLLSSVLLAAILAGTSSEIVVGIIDHMNIRSHIKTLLKLEAVFTDPLGIVIALTVLGILTASTQFSAFQGLAAAFSIGIVVGLFGGILWISILERIKGRPFDYILTIAVLLLIYTFVQSAGGSGALAALFFGLVLGNAATFADMLRFKEHITTDMFLKKFQAEISFFIRSFFFVFLGMIVSINPSLLWVGIGLSLLLIVGRVIAAHFSVAGMQITPFEKNITTIMVPRGLAPAVLAQIARSSGIAHAAMIADLVFIVILVTVLYTTLLTLVVFRKNGAHPAEHGVPVSEKKERK